MFLVGSDVLSDCSVYHPRKLQFSQTSLDLKYPQSNYSEEPNFRDKIPWVWQNPISETLSGIIRLHSITSQKTRSFYNLPYLFFPSIQMFIPIPLFLICALSWMWDHISYPCRATGNVLLLGLCIKDRPKKLNSIIAGISLL
jgi:hypothetical protein